MTESLKKCYRDVATAFNEYIRIKGISEEILTKAQIEQYLRDKGVVIDTFFLPSDMCYNHTTKPMGSDDEFETTPRLFEYVGRNKYRVLGSHYPYTGKIIRKSKNNGEFVVGEWKNGELIKWDKEKVLDDFDSKKDESNIKKEHEDKGKKIDELLEDPNFAAAIMRGMDLDNLGVIAPHKAKYYNRYDMQWLINMADRNNKLDIVTFWKADPGCENRELSQWYQGNPFVVNGRKYYTAEQYMMSEKALFAKDYDAYDKIMKEKDPDKCKKLGRLVKNLDSKEWAKHSREVLFHGNLGKLQGDLVVVDALLETGDAILVEASPYDDLYGAGIAKDDLLNPDGSLRIHPRDWYKDGSARLAENRLGFVLMGIRDLFRDLMPKPRIYED